MNTQDLRSTSAPPVLILLLLMAALVGCTLRSGITVTATNGSTNQITDLVIAFSGGTRRVARLGPSDSFSTVVNPDGPSHLEIRFVDSAGKRRSEKVGVYFEHDYSGQIDITVDADSKVTWKGEVRIPRF